MSGEEIMAEQTINWSYLGAGALVAVMVLFAVLLLIPRIKANMWTGLALGGVSMGVAVVANNWANLWSWLALGITGDNAGAQLFLYGMFAMCAVMAWNLLATRGRTAVR